MTTPSHSTTSRASGEYPAASGGEQLIVVAQAPNRAATPRPQDLHSLSSMESAGVPVDTDMVVVNFPPTGQTPQARHSGNFPAAATPSAPRQASTPYPRAPDSFGFEPASEGSTNCCMSFCAWVSKCCKAIWCCGSSKKAPDAAARPSVSSVAKLPPASLEFATVAVLPPADANGGNNAPPVRKNLQVNTARDSGSANGAGAIVMLDRTSVSMRHSASAAAAAGAAPQPPNLHVEVPRYSTQSIATPCVDGNGARSSASASHLASAAAAAGAAPRDSTGSVRNGITPSATPRSDLSGLSHTPHTQQMAKHLPEDVLARVLVHQSMNLFPIPEAGDQKARLGCEYTADGNFFTVIEKTATGLLEATFYRNQEKLSSKLI